MKLTYSSLCCRPRWNPLLKEPTRRYPDPTLCETNTCTSWVLGSSCILGAGRQSGREGQPPGPSLWRSGWSWRLWRGFWVKCGKGGATWICRSRPGWRLWRWCRWWRWWCWRWCSGTGIGWRCPSWCCWSSTAWWDIGMTSRVPGVKWILFIERIRSD